jgi:protein-S-isoprenylcysteine O-methyltransferase Ste14
MNRKITWDRRLMPPTLLFVCLMAMLALRLLFPGPVLFSGMGALAGGLVLVAGLGITIIPDHQFKKAGTPVSPLDTPTTLVTDELYRYSRNPMYLGFAVVLAGVWLMLGALTPLIGVLAFVIVTDRWYIAYEEEKMAETFGQAYQAYRRQVRRWI